MTKRVPVYILEGLWWSTREPPLVLPYFEALSRSHLDIDLSHRTFRSAADIKYYVSRIPKSAGALIYFASHGKAQSLTPVDGRSPIRFSEILTALESKKTGALSFVHFGCCETMSKKSHKIEHERILRASGARWSSGYLKTINWLPSLLLDLALVSEVFVPSRQNADGRCFKLKNELPKFVKRYDALAKDLGFSALAKVTNGQLLVPQEE